MYTQNQRQEHVREIQEYLRALAAIDQRYPLIGVDGIYGPETEQAVRVFQTITDSPATGIVQRADYERMAREYRDLLGQLTPADSISPFPDPAFVLRAGSRDPLTYILQVMLNTLSATPLTISGTYDDATVEQVRKIQIGADLPPSGEVDRVTWNLLALAYNFRV